MNSPKCLACFSLPIVVLTLALTRLRHQDDEGSSCIPGLDRTHKILYALTTVNNSTATIYALLPAMAAIGPNSTADMIISHSEQK